MKRFHNSSSRQSPLQRSVLLLVTGLLAFGAVSQAEAQQPGNAKPATGAGRSLDQELLEDLDNELLDGVNKKLPPEKPVKPVDKRDAEDPAGRPSAGGATNEDPEAMGEDLGAGPEDPLVRIGRDMRVVERLIAEKKAAETGADSATAGSATAGHAKAGQLQEQIVEQLAKLIESLEKQQQQASSASGKKGQQALAGRQRINQPKPAANSGNQQASRSKSNPPARDSTERLGKNETQRPDPGQMKGLMKDLWGQLPAHAREQMLQTSPEQFLPRYELQIEKYYKRLAEQQKESH